MTTNRVYIETNWSKLSGWYDVNAIIESDVYEHIAEVKGVDIDSEFYAVLRDSDFLVTDCEGALASAFYGSYSTFDWQGYKDAREWLDSNPHYDEEAVAAFVEWEGDWDSSRFEESYCGEWDSLRAYVEETFVECYEVPPHLENYIDWEAVTRDWSYEHYFYDGHVFRSI